MTADKIRRFAANLQRHAGVAVELKLDWIPTGLQILSVNGVDFPISANRDAYDRWSLPLLQASAQA